MDISLQEQVWDWAQDRCEYCHFPAQITRVPFQLDHIIAEKHGGLTLIDNLALSCFFCNSSMVGPLSVGGPSVAWPDGCWTSYDQGSTYQC